MPLAARNIVAKQPAVAVKTESASTSPKPNPLPAPNPQNVIKRKAAQKAPVIDSDSEDDKPLLTRAKPAARQGDHCSPNACSIHLYGVSAALQATGAKGLA